MKVKFWSAILCSCLFLGVSAASSGASAQTSQNGVSDTPDPQAQQSPAQTAPAQTPPQTAPGTPAIPKPTVQLPPAPPQETQPSTIPPQYDTEGDYFSIEPIYWLTKSSPVMSPGNGNLYTGTNPAGATIGPGSLHFPGKSKYGWGGVITVPTTRENSVQFTVFRIKGQGNSTLPTEVNFFGNEFSQGDLLASSYTVTTLKLSWNYLTWPYPSKGAKLRIKTLWEVQTANVSSAFNAPADTTAIETYGSKRVVLPTLGGGVEYHASKRFYLNLKASAFGIPHGADLIDGEAEAVLRFGRTEGMIGDRYYHFKTSPGANDQYFFFTMTGPFVGLRYTWR